MATSVAERWSPGVTLARNVSGPLQAVVGLFAMSAEALRFAVRRPFHWREFLDQAWFVARVLFAPSRGMP